MDRDYAENVNYWKSGSAAPDRWIDKAKREIRSVGGQIIGDMTVNDEATGRAAFCLAFVLQGEKYQIKWPVLESKTGNLHAARRQAATALYHDVKARCVELKFLGARAAFMAFLQLPDGRTAAEAANSELVKILPEIVATAQTQITGES